MRTDNAIPNKTTSTSNPTNYVSQFLLTIVALALFLLVKSTLGQMVFEKVKIYKQEYRSSPIPQQSLMEIKFGLDYLLGKYLVEAMKPAKPIFLTPPVQYTRKFVTQASTFSLTNPIYMFYMNSDIQTMSLNNPDYYKSNCTVLIDSLGQCYPMKINTRQDLDFAVNLFKSNQPYTPQKK